MLGSFSLLQYFLLGLFPLMLFVWLGAMGVLAIKRRWGWMSAVAAPGLLGPLWLVLMVYHPLGPVDRLRVLAQAQAPDKTRLVLTQSRNPNWAEPYTVYCWVKPPEHPWGCMPVEYAAFWWRSGEIRLEDGHALVSNGRDNVLDLDLKTLKYMLSAAEEIQEPVWVRADNWEPREGGEFRDVLDRAYGRKYQPPKKVTRPAEQTIPATESDTTESYHDK